MDFRPTLDMDKPIDIRATLNHAPARLVEQRRLPDDRIRADYELCDGRRIFLVGEKGDKFPDAIDNSTDYVFHEYRLLFLEEFLDDDEPDVQLLVGIARVDYEPNQLPVEHMLDTQARMRINTGTRLAPIDFGSLNMSYDDLVGGYLDYGQCNYNYLIENPEPITSLDLNTVPPKITEAFTF